MKKSILGKSGFRKGDLGKKDALNWPPMKNDGIYNNLIFERNAL